MIRVRYSSKGMEWTRIKADSGFLFSSDRIPRLRTIELEWNGSPRCFSQDGARTRRLSTAGPLPKPHKFIRAMRVGFGRRELNRALSTSFLGFFVPVSRKHPGTRIARENGRGCRLRLCCARSTRYSRLRSPATNFI